MNAKCRGHGLPALNVFERPNRPILTFQCPTVVTSGFVGFFCLFGLFLDSSLLFLICVCQFVYGLNKDRKYMCPVAVKHASDDF